LTDTLLRRVNTTIPISSHPLYIWIQFILKTTMTAFNDFTKHLSQYHPLSEGLTEYLEESVTEKVLPKNYKLLEAGKIPKHIWYLPSGSARVHRVDENTAEDLTLWYWQNELILPLDGLFSQTPARTTISLDQQSTVIALSYIHLKHLNHLFPEYYLISQGYLERINQKLSEHLDLIQHAESAARYAFLMKYHSSLLLHAGLKDIASFLGMSISTIKHLRYG